jgi:hypothetical protein
MQIRKGTTLDAEVLAKIGSDPQTDLLMQKQLAT